MANENEIIPVLSGDESDCDEMQPMEEGEEMNDVGNPVGRSLEQQLNSFRHQWQQELGQRQEHQVPQDQASSMKTGPNQTRSRAQGQRDDVAGQTKRSQSPANSNSNTADVIIPTLNAETMEEKAKYLFRQGIKHERNGRMYDAVLFYKQALQLVPDIESRVQESEGNSRTGSNQVSDDEENNNEVEEIRTDNAVNDLDQDIDALTMKLQRMTTNDLKRTCRNNTPQTATHISVLPLEVLLYIFRWVVSSDLDLRSLEQLCRVCRGFYVCSRDAELWKRACVRMWGKMGFLTKEYCSWRQMYVERPHPHFNGVYISRVTYVRQGQPSMDAFYKPWHIVEYHRFLRVFSDGTIMLVSCADDPQTVVSKMQINSPLNGKMVGRYRIVDDILVAELEKEKVKEIDQGRRFIRHRQAPAQKDDSEQTFHMELRMSKWGHRPNLKLEWTRYACYTTYRSTGNTTETEFDMNHQFYPFYFSRVKSYTKTSEAPL